MPEPSIQASPWRVIVRTSRSPSGSFDTEQGCEFAAVARPKDAEPDMVAWSRRWREVMKNRKRWERDSHALEYERKNANADLRQMFGGRYDDLVFSIMDSAFVEVSLNPTEDWTWTAPWEFLLTAVRAAGEEWRAPLVIRTFDQSGPPEGKKWTTDCDKLLTVLSTPGSLAEHYPAEVVSLEERTMSENFLGATSEPLHNPSLDEVSDEIDAKHPWAVHLAGVDVHQASGYLSPGEYRGERLKPEEDGMILGRDAPEEVGAAELAREMCKRRWLPMVLGCNFYFSNRIAAFAVAEGFNAAVGFDGKVDDISAQNFFADFYLALRLCVKQGLSPILEAFRIAFDTQVRRNEGLRSAVVLYSRTSLLKPGLLFAKIAATAPSKLLKEFNDKRDASSRARRGQSGSSLHHAVPGAELFHAAQ